MKRIYNKAKRHALGVDGPGVPAEYERDYERFVWILQFGLSVGVWMLVGIDIIGAVYDRIEPVALKFGFLAPAAALVFIAAGYATTRTARAFVVGAPRQPGPIGMRQYWALAAAFVLFVNFVFLAKFAAGGDGDPNILILASVALAGAYGFLCENGRLVAAHASPLG